MHGFIILFISLSEFPDYLFLFNYCFVVVSNDDIIHTLTKIDFVLL